MKEEPKNIETLIKEGMNGYKPTAFDERVSGDRLSSRANAILEYLNGYILKENKPYIANEISYCNKFWRAVRPEEQIYQSDGLKKFDAFVMHSIKEAVNSGKIDKSTLGKYGYFVDVVDYAERVAEGLDAKGKAISEKKLNRILKRAISEANLRKVKESSLDSIKQKSVRENSRKELTDYTEKISDAEIEAHMPQSDNPDARRSQMLTLFRAYQSENYFSTNMMEITDRNDTMEVMRSVLSKDRRVRYEGPIYVTQDDVTAIAKVSQAFKHIRNEAKKGKQVEGFSKWEGTISSDIIMNTADTLIGMANVMRENSQYRNLGGMITNDMAQNTLKKNLAKNALGKESYAGLAKKQKVSVLQKAKGLVANALEKAKSKMRRTGEER